MTDDACDDGSLIQTLFALDATVEDARSRNAHAPWVNASVEGVSQAPLANPEYIAMSMVLDEVYDAQPALEKAHERSNADTRVTVVTYGPMGR